VTASPARHLGERYYVNDGNSRQTRHGFVLP
jgi:hypothetical protein